MAEGASAAVRLGGVWWRVPAACQALAAAPPGVLNYALAVGGRC